MPHCGPARLADSQLATELPLCFEALFGRGWCNNNLNLAQMVGAMQLGYLRAWLRLKKPRCDLCRCTKRSLMEPATRDLQLRQRIVQALAETLRSFPRVFHCIGM